MGGGFFMGFGCIPRDVPRKGKRGMGAVMGRVGS